MLRSLINKVPRKIRDKYRSHWYQFLLWPPIYFLIRSARELFPRPFPKPPDDRVYVHLGSGPIDHPWFINVDTVPWPSIHHIHGVDRLPMFPDESIDLIYCSHCLEHIPYATTMEVLREWNRVLKTGGKLRLSVPDFDAILRCYEGHDRCVEKIQGYLLGEQTYPTNFHYAVFTRSFLEKSLLSAGFGSVDAWQHSDFPEISMDDCSQIQIETPQGSFPISLNLVATKSRSEPPTP